MAIEPPKTTAPIYNMGQDMVKVDEIEGLDDGIKEAVSILQKHGFKTFESCQGGNGHCYELPTVRFFGDKFDLIQAWEICQLYGLEVFEAKRVYRKAPLYENDTIEKGLSWERPFNEIIFK